jgi:tripartite-type tricarboxylate transporter receptor subunit TctC
MMRAVLATAMRAISMLAAMLAPACVLAADSYPTKPVRWVVPFAPGGNADTLSRTVAQKITDTLGQQVVVDNRSGANGNIGMEIVARASPDGHTVVLGYIANVAIAPSLVSKLPYDILKDYAHISQLASSPNIFVAHPSVNARNFKELVALAKSKPKSLSFGTAGVASVGHLTGELINTLAGIDLQHVPYKGSGQTVIDVLAGQIQLLVGGMSSVMPHIKSGRLRALAVTGAQRSPVMPDVATLAESGFPGLEATAWYGVHAPANTPRVIVNRLHADMAKALTLPDVKQRLEGLGYDLVGSPPDVYAAYIKSEIVKWAKVVKASGAKAE